MYSAIVYFANGSTLKLKEDDFIRPIAKFCQDDENFSTAGEVKHLYIHHNYGLIPAIMDILLFCEFFYVNDEDNIVYNPKTIVRIENQ